MKERRHIMLIADDAPGARASFLRNALSRDSAARQAVIEAESCLPALELRRARGPDCLILKGGLQGLRVLDALRKTAAQELAPDGAGGAPGRLKTDRAEKAESQRSATGLASPQRIVAARPESAVNHGAEEQLRLLKTAIEQSNEPVIIMTAQLDPPGPRIVFVSPAFTKMTGYAPEEAVGKTPHILQGPKTDLSVLSRLCKDCMAGKVFHGEMVNYRKDRSEFYLEWTAGPVRNERGEVTHFAAALRDVTEARRIVEESRRSEKEFRSLFELSAVGMAQVSPEGRYLQVNRKFCQMMGYSEQELLRLTVYDVTHPDDRETSAIMVNASFTGIGPEEYSMEKRYVRKDGAIIWALVNWTVIRDAEGRSLHSVASVQDITARKLAEEALRESHAFNQAVLGSLASHIAVLDRDGNIVAVNEAWKRFARENDGAAIADSVGMNYLDVCRRAQMRGDRDAGVILNGIQAVLDGARANFTIEYPSHSPEKERWFLMSVTPLLGAGGGAVVAHTDITQRKQVKESLRASEKRLELAQTAGNIGTFDWDIRADKAVWTEQLRTLFGMPPGAFSGTYKGWLELILPEDRPACEASMREILEKRLTQWRMEYRIRRADTGEVRWIDSYSRVFYDENGEPLRLIGSNMDITERKRVEAEREESLAREQAARAAAEHAAESIRRLQAMTDSALANLNLDDLLRDMLARIRDLLATDTAAILLLAEDGQSLSVRATSGWEETATDQSVRVGEGVSGSIAASGAPMVVENVSAVERPERVLPQNARSMIGAPLIVEGRLIGVIQTSTTQARRFRNDDVRLLQLAADRVALAIEHARLYEVERQARRQAEEANRMKDEFLALVSHELRSPLNAILGYAALLRYGRLDSQKLKHAADVIERSGKAQAQLIDDLLDTARIISGKLRLDVGLADLVSVIEQAVQTIHPAADAKGISIKTNFASEVSQITGDPARLQQVVWNLLSNAVKFTPQGGRVEVRLERIDPHICITVSDTGKGISPDFLPYVFDRFRQADASSARRYGGLGLGLTLVKYLVELHGGTVDASSPGEGQGATFKVTLPVRAVTTSLEETGGAPVRVESSRELAGVRALVVDDENDARELIETVLTQYGADVVAVGSAAEAYSLITTPTIQWRPDVMVTDIGMPDEDGYSLIRRVREWERGRGSRLPAVALTAYGRVEDRVRALNAGFQMHVAKPVEPAELAAVIASLLRRLNIGETTAGPLDH